MVASIPNALPELNGYSLCQLIYEGDRTAVYRALDEARERQPVVIKFLCSEYPSVEELVQFRNQYQITRELSIPGIVAPLALKPWRNGYALIMEDMGGIDLGKYAEENDLAWQDILGVGIQLASILHDLNQHRIIHKAIQPAHILIHPETQTIKLISFSLASRLPKEIQKIQSPGKLEGTLAYLAPEQTGRMNRGSDYRADFYALGITLYELLTGELPFHPEDLIELLHCHMAIAPPVPHEVNPQIPAQVSAMVVKLMAKTAESRYQSALGLKYDIEQCLTQWQAVGSVGAFELGTRDLCDRFLISEKLYGRRVEVQTLLDAFERVSQGAVELMLVAGFSGIGKTAVVNEIHKPVTQRKGYFIKGKFDQFKRNIPFSAFVQAFRSLMGQLLGESDTALAAWQRKILAAVEGSGQVLIDVIPELEHIIGVQPPVQALSGQAAQNRFNFIFGKFIQLFTTPEHPLVLFLDDLQWADSASLQLLKLLMDKSDLGHLLVLGAYRDKEVFSAHPLMLTLDELEQQSALISTLVLKPLNQVDVNQLVGDTLQCDPIAANLLSELVYQKTGGNPFFTTQFLQGLYSDGYISFDVEAGNWQCDLTGLKQVALTDDVVALLVGQLRKLSEAEQAILKMAACIGNQFDLTALAIVCKQSQRDVSIALWRSLQAGFVIPETENYKFFRGNTHSKFERYEMTIRYRFLHDRVQQAAYALIPEAHRKRVHWDIGQLLWGDHTAPVPEENLFEIVNHLNQGYDQHLSCTAQCQLAELNYQAGVKAKHSAAYQAAYQYCTTGISILSATGWHIHYDLMYRLHYQGAEAAYLSNDFEGAEILHLSALGESRSDLDRATIYRLQMTQYQLQGRNVEVISIQRKSLKLLGWELPENAETIETTLEIEVAAVKHFLSQHRIASILKLPVVDNANIIEMLRSLQILFYAAWLDGQPTLAFLALAKMTTLSLQYGNSEMSPFGYVGYGMLANALLKQADIAYQFGEMAVQLCEKFDNPDVRGMAHFLFAADVQSWSRPIREAIPYYDSAYTYGMQAGNWLTVSFTMMLSGS
ncbi:MAG: serine/threonine-protein kinase PknK, partial [Cyanobacteria bacterium P01_F01_bin.53]